MSKQGEQSEWASANVDHDIRFSIQIEQAIGVRPHRYVDHVVARRKVVHTPKPTSRVAPPHREMKSLKECYRNSSRINCHHSDKELLPPQQDDGTPMTDVTEAPNEFIQRVRPLTMAMSIARG